jgi:hypothetical protein
MLVLLYQHLGESGDWEGYLGDDTPITGLKLAALFAKRFGFRLRSLVGIPKIRT